MSQLPGPFHVFDLFGRKRPATHPVVVTTKQERINNNLNIKAAREEARLKNNAKILAQRKAQLKKQSNSSVKIDDVYKPIKPLSKVDKDKVHNAISNPTKLNEKLAAPILKRIDQELFNTNKLPKSGKVSSNETVVDDRGYVIPGFNYLGPGNSLNRGNPVNDIDADAQIHDNQYNQAKTSEHVKAADREFTQKAIDHFIEGIGGAGNIGNTFGGAIGGIGIGIKNLIEKKTGVLYPSNLSGKLWHHLIIYWNY